MLSSEFIGQCIQHMTNSGITIKFINGKPLKEGKFVYSGYFDGYNKVFCVDVNEPLEYWIKVFVHEYCHFLQYLDGLINEDYYATSIFSDWVAGDARVTKRVLNKHCKLIQFIELDAERRALRLIKKHKLPINTSEYTQEANYSVLLFTMTKKYRKWFTSRSYQARDVIVASMPKRLITSFSKMPDGFEDLVLEHCVAS